MSFLAPLFLLGAAAVALPIVFHLIRRTTRERIPFSSLLFLTPSPPRLTQKSRIEDLLLLLLRCLVLILLALGFARPFLPDSTLTDPSQRPPQRVLHLVDVSASMQREGLWDAARNRVLADLRATSPGDEFALWTFDRQARPLVTFADWNAAPPGDRSAIVRSQLDAVKPGWSSTHLDTALTAVAELLVDDASHPFPGPRRIVVVSDLQEGSRLDQLQSFEWPEGLEVQVAPLKPRRPGNAGIQILPDSPTAPTSTQNVVRVRVTNSADSESARFGIGWASREGDSFLGQAEDVQVPPGQSRVVQLPILIPPSSDGPIAPGATEGPSILLRGDDEVFDNRAYVVPPSLQPISALYLGRDTSGEPRQPLYFLRRALPPTGRLAVAITTRRPGDPLDPATLRAAGIYFVTEAIPESATGDLRRELESGKTLVFVPRTAADAASIGGLLGLGRLPAEEAQPRNYAMLASLDFRHPLLAPFGDPRFSDFTHIHFWKYRRIDVTSVRDARIAARFDTGDPALVEIPVGRGRIVVLASGWHPEDSQFGVSTKFVPLLCSLCEIGAAELDSEPILTVGDPLPIPAAVHPDARPSILRQPDGTEITLDADATSFAATAVPGIYTLASDGVTRRFAVNVDGREARTLPIPIETLEGLGTPLHAQKPVAPPDPARRLQLAGVEAESRQKLWRWLIVAALAILLIESAMAGWKSRQLSQPSEGAP